ncbi:putative reverse transcriptase domain-containing protein [Tanacetum coccineum]
MCERRCICLCDSDLVAKDLLKIMPPRMRTRSVGRPVAESRGGGTGGLVEVEGVEDLGEENVKNVIVNGNWVGCSYKEFLACQPKEYDGKGGVIVLTRWIKKMESVQDMSGCSIDQKVKYTAGSFVVELSDPHEMQKLETKLWNHAMVGASYATYTDRFHELARLVPYLVTPESRKIERYVYGLAPQICGMVAATEPKTIQKAVQISGALTEEAVRNGSIKKVEKRGNVGEPRKDKNGRDNKKRTMPGKLLLLLHTLRKKNMGALAQVACYECGSADHVRSACPRLNRAQGPEGNRPNQVAANNGGQGLETKGTKLGVGHFMLGVEEAHKESEHYDGHNPASRFHNRKIEITKRVASRIDKVIKGCKLEIEGHVFDIDLIPFGHGSFDVIIGMNWLSNHKAEIICHEKVVRIPLLDGKVHRVLEKKPKEKIQQLKMFKAKEKEQEEIVMVRDFLEVFPDDLSGLPPAREIEFRIELIPRASPVVKSPYRLVPSELEELSGQLKEL